MHDIFALGASIEHADRLGNDEIDRLADKHLNKLLDAWHIDNVLNPIFLFLFKGELNIKRTYEGDISDSIRSFGSDSPPINDPDDVRYNIYYTPVPLNLIFPLIQIHLQHWLWETKLMT